MVRSIVSIVVGLAVVVVGVMVASWGVAWVLGVEEGAPSTAYLVVNVVGSTLAAVAGGLVTALIAEERGFLHAVVLAVILVILGLVDQGAQYLGRPSWYPVAIGILGPLGALLGGLAVRARRLARERRARRASAAASWEPPEPRTGPPETRPESEGPGTGPPGPT